MKKTLLFCLAISFPFFAVSQLSNGSFEKNSDLPSTVGEYELVNNWSNCNSDLSSPDYYHVNGANGGDLPNTPAATLNPFKGEALMGLTLCGESGSNKREYLSTKLETPLEIGETYIISFYITNGAVPNSSNAGYAVDKIGMLLSQAEINQSGLSPILETPQFEIEEVLYNREWQRIKYRFEAVTAHEYLTIGIFHNDSDLEFVKNETNAQLSYYFFDDFVVRNINDLMPDDPFTETPPPAEEENVVVLDDMPYYIPNSFTPNGDGENDFFYPVINTEDPFVFEVYSKWGELLFQTSKKEVGWDGTNKGTEVSSEVYVWKLKITSTNDSEERVAEHFHGQITLLK